MLDHCEVCGRRGYLKPTASLLDSYLYDTCASCLEANAEDWRAIGNYLRHNRWSDLPLEIASVLTVWQDEDYVPAKKAMRRMLDRQLVPCNPVELPPEDEEVFQHVLEKWRAVKMPERPLRKPWWREWFAGWLFPGWRVA